MKIIKAGKPKAERIHRLTCTNCTCVFEFEEKEAHYNSDQRDGDYLSIGCPYCHHIQTSAVKKY